MDNKRYTPSTIVSENLLFSIPLYQRLFAWKEVQIKGLLYDLFSHFQISDKPYYLGMLSCIEDNGRYDLIDGQQRFTVLILMGIVFRRYDKRWASFLDKGSRLYFIARPKDVDYLQSRIAGNENIPDVNTKMENAIITIEQFLGTADLFKTDDSKKSFAEKTFDRLSFYFSILPNCYQKQPTSLNKYFEAMNSYGKGLEQHEILKVQLIKEEENKEYLTKVWNVVSEMGKFVIKQGEDTSDSFREYYRQALNYCRCGNFHAAFDYCESSYDSENDLDILHIEEKPRESLAYSSEVAENHETNIISFCDFLKLTLDITLNLDGKYSFYRKDLITIFEENPITDIQSFYNNLLYFRLLIDYYVISKENVNGTNKYSLLYKQGIDTDDSAEKESIVQYQSMLYVSQPDAFYNWLKPLILELEMSAPFSYKDYLQKIKQIDNKQHILPNDVSLLSYNNGVDRYWFWRLDYYLWERRKEFFNSGPDEEIVSSYVFRTNRSIEHLHPQHQDNNQLWEEENIHTFGNLAMISQSFNSEQSDDPVTVKFARVKDQAENRALQSIKLYKMYLDAEKMPNGWTVDVMIKHQSLMYQILQESFM